MPVITPIVLGVAALATAGYGAYTQMQGAKAQQEAQARATAAEQRQEQIRQQAMELEARRRQIEIVRQRQRAQAMGLATATSQGAAQGSGLQGGYAQAAGQSNFNALGISQNLQLGQQMFGANIDLSNARMGIAQGQSQMAMGNSLSSLGGAAISAAGTIGQFTQNWAGGSGSAGYYGGSPATNSNLMSPWGYGGGRSTMGRW